MKRLNPIELTTEMRIGLIIFFNLNANNLIDFKIIINSEEFLVLRDLKTEIEPKLQICTHFYRYFMSIEKCFYVLTIIGRTSKFDTLSIFAGLLRF